tara:strand:+ start:379 stop:645 length:267 start_codon:yes stop_codon:yes gene_type:complete
MNNIITGVEMFKKLILIGVAGLMLSGCYATTTQVKKDMITLGGCVSGGVAGNQIGSGNGKKLATAVGILAGCKMGGAVADKVVDKDQN